MKRYEEKFLLLLCMSIFSINSAFGYDIHNVEGENYSYQFNIFRPGESIHYAVDFVSSFEITKDYITPFCSAAEKWASIIKSSAVKPIVYAVITFNEYNAAAASLPVKVSETPYDITGVNAVINNLNVTKSYIANPNGMILLGLGISPEHSGWAPFTGNHSLYHGEIPDLNVVILHELMHSIGLTSYAGDTDIPEELGYTPYGILDKNLTIYTGDTSEPFDTNKEFIYQKGMVAGNDDSDFDVVHNPTYFSGEETLKVLSGKDNYDAAKQAIIENGGLINYSGAYAHNNRPKVYGLPIHSFDGDADGEYEIDLSHIELRNSFMSHQDYRNWTVPMEAELAVLKDIGYNIDLRRHFGKSYYLNGITDVYTDGFSEWNGTSYTGNPSNDTQTVGIHIYGNNNNITQASDILSNGEGSFGVRIDGLGNTFTLASGNSIITNGKENLALAATWGKNHVINIEQDAVVSALGEDGIAASFDFGSNIFGIYQDTRGSYINYSGDFNLNSKPDSETNDSLIDEFNVSGTLEGSKAAIYISDNAYVKNINIKDGAVINGDVISDWNSASSTYNSKVMIKDYSEEYGFEYYRPRDISNPAEILYTNLNFTGESNISGNINGENGIFNTLILNNSGIVNFDGETISVNTLNNFGTLNLSSNVKTFKNIVNLKENSLLST